MTPAQIATLKALVASDPAAAALAAAANDQELAGWLNAASTFVVWRPVTDAASVFDAVSWAAYTPTDAADGTTLFQNRAEVCRLKQANLHIMFEGSMPISTAKNNIRQTLKDALQAIPSGPAGAAQDAGWAAVKTAISRFATVAEKALATGTGTAGTPGFLTFEGEIDAGTASTIRS
jgi:hypothetical protein